MGAGQISAQKAPLFDSRPLQNRIILYGVGYIRLGLAVGATVGNRFRTIECRNVQCAVAFHAKLTADRNFAAQWVRDTK